MTNNQLIEQFYKITAPNGTNISKRHKESYWRKYGYGAIYDQIIQNTMFMCNQDTLQLSERIVGLKSGLNIHPKCITCGNPVMIIERDHFSEYCSKPCFYKDPNFKQKKIESFKKVDKVAAKTKRSKTMLEKYGVEYNSQRAEIKEILSESKIKYSKPDALEKLLDKEWLYKNYITDKRTLVDIAEELDVFYGTVGDYCRSYEFPISQRSNYSLEEVQLMRFIEECGFASESDKIELDGYEIDIYLKDLNFGIEVDGAYWHSYNRFETTKEKNKHLSKTVKCLEKGINLIHIFDLEWKNKKDIVKSIVASKLGISNKIYARSCSILEVSKEDTKKFNETNHIQGHTGSSVNLGLYYNDQLVMLMTFGKPRFNKGYQWELIRLSTLLNNTVTGGASKLFKHFNDNYLQINESVICYSDRRFGEGNVYNKLGFEFTKSTPPGYYWTNGNIIWSRTKFQKAKLSKLLSIFDPKKSEAENMFDNKYRRLWDCGVNVWKFTKI
jgi:hypothetical protein